MTAPARYPRRLVEAENLGPTPIFDDLKAERARHWAADQLEADAVEAGWWRRGQLLREARELRGGVL